MGFKEADRDGIKYYFDDTVGARGVRGAWVYLVQCSKCGATMKSLVYGPNRQFVCPECKYKLKVKRREIEADLLDGLTTKSDRRFMAAVDKIRKQTKGFDEKYSRAVNLAGKAREKYGSVPEAMVAIELLYLGYKVIPQQRIGKYRVDFYLPDERIAVEVDGSLYHQKQKTNRDAVIQLSLGMDARIVHIPAELIAENIHKLERCIKLP